MNAGILWGTGSAMAFLALTLILDLGVVLWVTVIAILYPACLAYGRYKRTHDQAWLRYL